MQTTLSVAELIAESEVAGRYSLDLIDGLTEAQISWRPHEDSSAIGWHLGHQAAVAHYLVRNLTAAEPRIAPVLDELFDSATEERQRGDLPALKAIADYRAQATSQMLATMRRIETGDVGAPIQLNAIAQGLLIAVINHEYQHAKWILEVRNTMTSSPEPIPDSTNLNVVEGYFMIGSGG